MPKTHKKFTSVAKIMLNGVMLVGLTFGLAACATQKNAATEPPVSKEERFPIIVKNGKAYTQKCGYWPQDVAHDFENRPYASFGCSTQSNLAAMIAKPQDLVKPRASTPSNGERRGSILSKFNAGETISSSDSSSSGSSSSSSTSSTTN